MSPSLPQFSPQQLTKKWSLRPRNDIHHGILTRFLRWITWNHHETMICHNWSTHSFIAHLIIVMFSWLNQMKCHVSCHFSSPRLCFREIRLKSSVKKIDQKSPWKLTMKSPNKCHPGGLPTWWFIPRIVSGLVDPGFLNGIFVGASRPRK